MRLPKIFAISQKSKVEIQIVSTVETGPKENRGFERPKLSQNLPKIFPKIRFKTPVRKYTGIFGICQICRKYTGIFGICRKCQTHTGLRRNDRNTYIPKMHSKPP